MITLLDEENIGRHPKHLYHEDSTITNGQLAVFSNNKEPLHNNPS